MEKLSHRTPKKTPLKTRRNKKGKKIHYVKKQHWHYRKKEISYFGSESPYSHKAKFD
jgi:hypothetical protein